MLTGPLVWLRSEQPSMDGLWTDRVDARLSRNLLRHREVIIEQRVPRLVRLALDAVAVGDELSQLIEIGHR
jgi:hypothetical protein